MSLMIIYAMQLKEYTLLFSSVLGTYLFTTPGTTWCQRVSVAFYKPLKLKM